MRAEYSRRGSSRRTPGAKPLAPSSLPIVALLNRATAARSIRVVARRAWRLVRLVGIGLVAGAAAGFLAGGVGSRLAMRAVTLLAGPEHRGELTEAQAVVGEITVDGTGFLLVAGTFLGLAGGLLYLAVRPWLPGSAATRGLAFGLWLLSSLGWVVIDGDNVDFRLFVPSAVSVGLFASLYLLFGLVVATIVERLDRGGGRRSANRVLAFASYLVIATAVAWGLGRDIASLRAIF